MPLIKDLPRLLKVVSQFCCLVFVFIAYHQIFSNIHLKQTITNLNHFCDTWAASCLSSSAATRAVKILSVADT